MPKLQKILNEFIDGKYTKGNDLDGNYGQMLGAILEEQNLIDTEIALTKEFTETLEDVVRELIRPRRFTNCSIQVAFQHFRQRQNWPQKMQAFVKMVVESQFQAQSKDTTLDITLFESLFENIKQGNIDHVLQAIKAHPEWVNQATAADHRSNIIIATLFQLRQHDISNEKRDNLVQFLHDVIDRYGQHLDLGFRDATGNTALHRVFWYAIQLEDEKTARYLADLGCKMVNLIRNSEAYAAIKDMRNTQYYEARPDGETFIDNIYFFPDGLTKVQERNRDYLHAVITPILDLQQKESRELVSATASSAPQSFFSSSSSPSNPLQVQSLKTPQENIAELIREQVKIFNCKPGEWFDLGSGLELGVSNHGRNIAAIRLGNYEIQATEENILIFCDRVNGHCPIADKLKQSLIHEIQANQVLNVSVQPGF